MSDSKSDQCNTWRHVAAVYKGPNEGEGITVYHDGVNTGNDTTRDPQHTFKQPRIVKIGRWSDDPGRPFYGPAHLDELIF